MKKDKPSNNKETPAPRPGNTIEEVENDYWGNEPEYDSHLVTETYKLRQKPLDAFTTENLRLLIGQQLSLPILMPMALAALEKNILASGDMYPGALLENVIRCPQTFWDEHPALKDTFRKTFVKNIKKLKGSGMIERDKERLFAAYEEFAAGEKVTGLSMTKGELAMRSQQTAGEG